MPELPEVECVRRSLSWVIGERITSVDIRRPDVVTGDCSPNGLLRGQCVVGLRRHGKQLALVSEKGTVVVHLGMTGTLLTVQHGHEGWQQDRHVHLRWRTGKGACVIFRDPRRFGGVWALKDESALSDHWRLLGPDALTITTGQLIPRLGATRQPIKSALLDQRVLAGVGNIYAVEALHRAGIHPMSVSRHLDARDVQRLARILHHILREAIRAGGTTLRDYTDSLGVKGGYALRHRVYGRGGLPCKKCKTPLADIRLAGRSTVYCGSCQVLL
ncbi:MAG: bifunctional DNA-formamidopyrimidine glycosylase/DNA-(apurinic or apyrimidinic site) lyase [Phycisphaera sp.]|nr:bifunctional DNA-formamidopyrimidine glycosylase/DNA-(apurinic or apyrimidinic site) lyase [Phycisphaera sp.]